MRPGNVAWKEEVPKTAAKPVAPVADVYSVECKPGTVYAPVSGTVIPSEEIPGETFAAGILGRGGGINPDMGIVVEPFDGEISFVTDTHHTVGVTPPDVIELLIHVGVDTVAMNGDGFECLVQEGQQVKAGDKLILDRCDVTCCYYVVRYIGTQNNKGSDTLCRIRDP